MYGFGGVGLSEVQISISELSVVGGGGWWVGGWVVVGVHVVAAAAAARDQDQLEEEKEDEGGLNRFQQAPPLWRGSWMRTGTETGQSGLVMGRSYKNRLS